MSQRYQPPLTDKVGNLRFMMQVNSRTSKKTIKGCNSILTKHTDSDMQIKEKTYKESTHWFHVVAIHQWVVACARDRMSTVHNSVWFSAGLQGSRYSPHTQLASPCLYSCVCSPHALIPLTYPCWSCSYPQTTYANKGWTIPGSKEGWPRVDAITVLQAWSRLLGESYVL